MSKGLRMTVTAAYIKRIRDISNNLIIYFNALKNQAAKPKKVTGNAKVEINGLETKCRNQLHKRN